MISIKSDFNLYNKDYVIIGSTPHNEEGTQAGSEPIFQILECKTYIKQLIRIYGIPPDDTKFFILKNTGHDFGIYYEAAIIYKEENEESIDYAFKLEDGCDNWDEISREILIANDYPLYCTTIIDTNFIKKHKNVL